MNIGDVLSQAWKTIWKHKVLWIFGIFAGCSSASYSAGNGGVSYQFDAPPDLQNWFDAIDPALEHEQPNPRHEPGHPVSVRSGTLLHRIVGTSEMQVNSSHHQAVREPGPYAVVNAVAPDQVIEGVEDPRHRFCLGVQWHPEFFIDPGDRRIFDALIAACRT